MTAAADAGDVDAGVDAHAAGIDLEGLWRSLVTTALLGTDRRLPSIPTVGGVGDVVADAVRSDDASRMLAAVGAVAATRRAAFEPLAPGPPLQPPVADDRPMCSPGAVSTWREVVREWPVLEDEWLVMVIDRGFRLPPDALVELLQRHRRNVMARARVAVAAGPLASWLIDHVPDLAPGSGGTVDAEALTTLPDLPVPPDLAELLGADAHTFSQRLATGFQQREFGQAHKAVLVNLIARCRPAVLVEAADEFERAGIGLAVALADLARLRHRMLSELGVEL